MSLSPGGNKIYNNQIIGGPQDGILISDYDSNSPGGSEIYSNAFKLKTRHNNSFAIEDGGRNSDIHDNIIFKY